MCLLASWIWRYKYNIGQGKLWKQIIYHKYDTHNPNVFGCSSDKASPFWKGVMWASKAAHFGYSCRVGKGTKVKFWEDQWFDNSSLAIRYWELYNIVNEKKIVIAHVWDGYNLKYHDKGMQIIKKKMCNRNSWVF